MDAGPRIETGRLILRPHRAADFEDCYAIWSDPAVTRFIGGRPSTRDEVWARLLRYAGLWSLLGYGYFAVEDRQSGRMIGDVGLADFRRAIDPPLDSPEAGWVIHSDFHNRGLAKEALTGLFGWADARGMTRTCCIIDQGNIASLRLAEKLGFLGAGEARHNGKEIMVLERLLR